MAPGSPKKDGRLPRNAGRSGPAERLSGVDLELPQLPDLVAEGGGLLEFQALGGGSHLFLQTGDALGDRQVRAVAVGSGAQARRAAPGGEGGGYYLHQRGVGGPP